MGQDKNCLLSEGEIEKEKKKTKQWRKGYHSPPLMGRPLPSSFPSKRWLTPLNSLLSFFFLLCVTLYSIEHPFAYFWSSAWWCSVPTACAPPVCSLGGRLKNTEDLDTVQTLLSSSQNIGVISIALVTYLKHSTPWELLWIKLTPSQPDPV